MSSYVYVDDKDAVESALSAAQKRASVNCLTHAKIVQLAEEAEEELSELLPKASRVGARYFYRPAGPHSNSYRNKQGATSILLERASRGWRVSNVEREQLYPREPERARLTLTPEQRDKAVERFSEKISVHSKEAR